MITKETQIDDLTSSPSIRFVPLKNIMIAAITIIMLEYNNDNNNNNNNNVRTKHDNKMINTTIRTQIDVLTSSLIRRAPLGNITTAAIM